MSLAFLPLRARLRRARAGFAGAASNAAFLLLVVAWPALFGFLRGLGCLLDSAFFGPLLVLLLVAVLFLIAAFRAGVLFG